MMDSERGQLSEREERQEEIELTTRSRGERDDWERQLEKECKPLFEPYGDQGVPINELKEKMSDPSNPNHDKFSQLIDKSDANHDDFLTYDEFMKMMTTNRETFNRQEKTKMKRLVKLAILNIIPQSQQNDFLETYSCCPPPLFMILITIVEVIIFIVYGKLLSDAGTPVTATSGIALYSPLVYNPYRRYEVWRYITYMFMHQGYMHLISNMVIQLLLGLPLELAHHWWRVILIYVLGVFAGSLVHSMADSTTYLVGASGGCYALLGAHIASVILNWKEMNYKLSSLSIKRLLLSAWIRLGFCLIFVFIDTGLAVYRRFFSDTNERIGIGAHMGGLGAGVMLGVVILRNIKKLEWERIVGWTALTIYVVIFIITVLYNSLYPGFPQTDWRPCCPGPPPPYQ